MEQKSPNIYKNARITAGLTQERWSEYLGISPDSVRKYEAGEMLPGDDVVLKMAEVSGQLILPYWHLTRKSRIAAAILPELEEEKGLPEAVLGLLIQIDGRITENEAEDYERAISQLSVLVSRAMALGYAK